MQKEIPKSYISITAFRSLDEVDRMRTVFERFRNDDQRRTLGVGVMTFGKMWRGEATRWSCTCPTPDELANVLCRDDVFNCLHYADFDPPLDVWKSIVRALDHAGPHVDAIQLDMVWPAPGDIEQAVHTSRKPVEVILQVGRNAFDEVGNDPARLVDRLEDYGDVIDRVLLDKSMGEGKELDPNFLLPFFRGIRERFPTLGLVAGGGLGPSTTHLVLPLHREFHDMSYDSQGKLYPKRDLFQNANWDDGGQYLIEMLIATRTC